MRYFKYLMRALLVTVMLAGCGALPKLSLTPVDADLTVGGQHETGSNEEAMVSVETGDQAQYITDQVEQTYNNIQEYPLWLIIAFAVACPSPFPSPLAAWRNRRERHRLEKQNRQLVHELALSYPEPTPTRSEEEPSGNNPA